MNPKPWLPLASLLFFALPLGAEPAAIEGERFPGETWLQYESPEEAGYSAEKLADAWAYWDSLDSAGFLVIVDGAVLVAWGDVDRRFLLHSARKSFMSGLYGIHYDAGHLDLDKTMGELGIDDENPPLDDLEKTARIEDLLAARSGVYHLAAAEPPQNPKPPQGSHAPGTNWCYNNWDFNALCTILEQETGIKTFEEIGRVFAAPLGMQDYRPRDGFYMYERQKSIHPAYHIRMSARDMARYGLLYLREGNWNGNQVLSEEWVARSTYPHSEDIGNGMGYAYMWWVMQAGLLGEMGMYSARGVGEQSIDVLPGANMVVVHRVNTFDGHQVSSADLKRLIVMVLEAGSDVPKPEPALQPLAPIERPWTAVDLTDDQKAAVCGTYVLPGWGEFRIALDGDDLIAGGDMETFGLIALAPDRFLVEDLHRRFCFVPSEPGPGVELIADDDLIRRATQLLASRPDEAIDLLVRATELFPGSARAHEALGDAFRGLGLTEEATARYERGLELEPENSEVAAKLEKR